MFDDGLFRVLGGGLLAIAALFLWLILYRHRHILTPQRVVRQAAARRRLPGWPDWRWETSRDAITAVFCSFAGLLLLTVADSVSGFTTVPDESDTNGVILGKLEFVRGSMASDPGDRPGTMDPHRITFTPFDDSGYPGEPVAVASSGDAVVLGYTMVTPRRTVLSTLMSLFGGSHSRQFRLDFVGAEWQQADPLTVITNRDATTTATIGRGRPPAMVAGRGDEGAHYPFPWRLWVYDWQFGQTQTTSNDVEHGGVGGVVRATWIVTLRSDGLHMIADTVLRSVVE